MDTKVEEYYKLAYGERDKQNPEEAFNKGHKDRMFIVHNLAEIEAYYQDCMQQGSGAQAKGKTEAQIVQEAIQHVKVEKFYNLAYAERDAQNPEEAFNNGRGNRMFIVRNLAEIEAYYENCMQPGSEAQHAGKTETQIVQEAIESLTISTVKIGKTTISAPTISKLAAEKVETGKNERQVDGKEEK